MIAVTATMRVLVAIKPVDFRRGIDGLSQICRSVLATDARENAGTIFVFRCRNRKSIKLLMHDTQGFWLCQKRLGSGRFQYWPTSASDTATAQLLADEFLTLLWAGNRKLAYASAPLLWQRVESDRITDKPGSCTETTASSSSPPPRALSMDSTLASATV